MKRHHITPLTRADHAGAILPGGPMPAQKFDLDRGTLIAAFDLVALIGGILGLVDDLLQLLDRLNQSS